MKAIHVEITTEEIQQLLEKHLVIKDKENFSKLIVGHLSNSNVALEQIYKGLLGIYPKFSYKEGDWVYVDISNLTSWRMNKESTLKLPSTLGQYIPCEITSVNPYNSSPYNIIFKYVKKDTEEVSDENYYVGESYIFKKVENIVDLLDEMEELQINNQDTAS